MSTTAPSLIDQGISYAMDAVWSPSPTRQIAVNLVIIVAAMLSSTVGFLPGLVIAGFALIFLGVGVVRLLLDVLR